MENTKVEIKDTELAAVTGGGTDPMDISDRIVRGDYGNGEARKYQLRNNSSPEEMERKIREDSKRLIEEVLNNE